MPINLTCVLPRAKTMNKSNSIQVTRQEDVTVITLGAEYEKLEEGNLQEVRTKVLSAIEDAEPPWVVVDLANVKFFGSAFIEVLFRAWNRLEKADGGKFAISGLTPYCREVLQVTNLDQLWDIQDTRADAINQLSVA